MSVDDFLAGRQSGPPRRLGTRYEPGRFLPEAGNTVVCHLDRSDPVHGAVLAARAQMQALPGAERLLFTPVESLHMTLFEGVIETRRAADAWPEGLDRQMPVAEVTDILAARLARFVPPPAFAVRVVGLHPGGLALDGASQADRRVMLDWRDALTVPFGYRHKEHDSYRFHMTFAYPLDWLPDDHAALWSGAMDTILGELRSAAPEIPLQPPAFCTFGDMTRFDPRVVLG